MALEFTKSQQATTGFVNRLIARLDPVVEIAGKTANEIKKEAAKKRPKTQPDVEVQTSSKKRPPPPPPAAAVKAIETAAVEGAKKKVYPRELHRQMPIWRSKRT